MNLPRWCVFLILAVGFGLGVWGGYIDNRELLKTKVADCKSHAAMWDRIHKKCLVIAIGSMRTVDEAIAFCEEKTGTNRLLKTCKGMINE